MAKETDSFIQVFEETTHCVVL